MTEPASETIRENRRSERPRQRRTLWLLIAAGAVILALAFMLLAQVFSSIKSPQQLAAEASAPAMKPVLTPVLKTTLSNDIVLRAIEVPGPADKVPTGSMIASASPVVTAVVIQPGNTVALGGVLFELEGTPSFAMNWAFPAYRDLTVGDSGPDVQALQSVLSALGYQVGEQGVLDKSTGTGLIQFLSDRGENTPQESKVVLKASQVVQVAANVPATKVEVTTGMTLKDPDFTLLEVNGKPAQVLAAATQDQASAITVGNSATLDSPDTKNTISLRVTKVASEPETVKGLGEGYPITLDAPDPSQLTALNQEGSYALTIHVGKASGEVLAVPVTAIYANPDGTSFVEVARKGTDGTENVTVDTGMEAGGKVEITPRSPGGVKEGDQVVVGVSEAN